VQVEVDQSGKIELTKVDTVLAFANDISSSVLVRATVKRQCLWELRSKHISNKIITLLLFSVGLFLLLRDPLQKGATVVIDTEYTGREGDIKGMILRMAKRDNLELHPDQIQFGQIGKKSSAHNVAIEVFRGKKAPDKVLTVKDILQWV
jgi:hypothetical protein